MNCLVEDTDVTMEEVRRAMTEDVKKGYMSQVAKMSEYARVFEEPPCRYSFVIR